MLIVDDEAGMKSLAIAAAALIWLAAACTPDPAATTCQTSTDCPSGFSCDPRSHLCSRTVDASVADAAVVDAAVVDAARADTTAADHGPRDQVIDRLANDAGSLDQSRFDATALDAAVRDVRVDSASADGYPDARVDAGADATIDAGGIDLAPADAGHPCEPSPCAPGAICYEPTPETFQCLCPGVECNGICYPSGRCCGDSDCTAPGTTCNSHLCSGSVIFRRALDGYDGVADTWIASWYPTMTNGHAPAIEIRPVDVYAPLFRFEVNTIPQNSLVTRAVLALNCYSRSNTNWMDVSVYQVLRPWDEGTTSWNQAQVSDDWAAAGCNDSTTDRAASPVSTAHVAVEGVWHEFDVVDLVRIWVNTPDDNHGLILKAMASQGQVDYWFHSSEHPTADLRPTLTVDYVAP